MRRRSSPAHLSALVLLLSLIAGGGLAVQRLTRQTPAEPRVFRDARFGYEIHVPAGWRTGTHEGALEIRPATMPSLDASRPTFSVTVRLLPEVITDFGSWVGAEVVEGTLPNRLPFVRIERRQVNARMLITRLGLKTIVRPCPGGAHVPCPPSIGRTLEIVVHAASDELLRRFGAQASALVRSVADLGTADERQTRVQSGYEGRTAVGIANDNAAADETWSLLSWLDSRPGPVQTGADFSLSSEAKKAFDFQTGGLVLYLTARYHVLSRRNLGGGKAEYIVRLYEIVDGRIQGVARELLMVGRGRNWNGRLSDGVILSARRLPDCVQAGGTYDC